MFRCIALASIILALSLVAAPQAAAQATSIAIEHDCATHQFLTQFSWIYQGHIATCSQHNTNSSGLCRSKWETDVSFRSHFVRVTPSLNTIVSNTQCSSNFGQARGPLLQCVATNPNGWQAIPEVTSSWSQVGCCGVTVNCSATPGTAFTVTSGSTTCAVEVFP